MSVCKSGVIAASVYLAVEVSLFVWASLHPSGVLYEFLPFVWLTFPWFLLFQPFLFDATGDFGSAFAGLVVNIATIYFVLALISNLRSKKTSGAHV